MNQNITLKTELSDLIKFITTNENKQLMKKAAVILGYPIFVVWVSMSLIGYGLKALHEAGIPQEILLQLTGMMLILLGIVVFYDSRKAYGRMVRNVCSKQEGAKN